MRQSFDSLSPIPCRTLKLVSFLFFFLSESQHSEGHQSQYAELVCTIAAMCTKRRLAISATCTTSPTEFSPHDGWISVRLGRQNSSIIIHHLLKSGCAQSFHFLSLTPIKVGLIPLALWEFICIAELFLVSCKFFSLVIRAETCITCCCIVYI